MKVQISRLAFGIALVVSALPAMAADFAVGGGSVKEVYSGTAVPVPAPMPVPEFKPAFYFRLDAGLGLISDPDVSGHIEHLDGLPGDILSGPDQLNLPSWFQTDFNTSLTLGGGVGYYFGNGWRIDATIEKRSKDDVYGSGTTDLADTWFKDANSLNYKIVDSNNDSVADTKTKFKITDSSSIDGTVWMLNGYYDLASWHGVTPYIGAGVGFSWNQIARTQTIVRQTCTNGVGGCDNDNYLAPTQNSNTNKSDTVSFAAAAMAGISWDITDITAIDIGYRYLFIGGTSASMDVGGADSTLEIGDQNVHQVRAGLRFNVN